MSAYQTDDFTQELDEARKIQMGMLPQSLPEVQGFQVAAHSSPAVAVGGDFYDFIPLGNDRLGIVIGDAVGHGIAAALLMTMTLTDFRSLAGRYASPSEVLGAVNRRLTQSMRTRAFVTAIYAVLDTASNRLTCAMAGMQPWLIKAKSRECVSIEPSGLPLGASSKIQYESCDMQMETGDSLVLFSDGIPEAVNEEDEFYSFEKLESALMSNLHADAQGMLDAVLEDLGRFTGKRPSEDDITILVLKAMESLTPVPVVPASRLITGERKSVTMLVAVGDDALPLHVAEEVNGLIREHSSVVDALGDDTLVALFGVPVTHEDDAERAVTAAQTIQELDMPVTFRVGIDTGTAIIRSDQDVDYHEMGATLRNALHLANTAEPGEVLVSDRAHQLSRGAFQFAEATQSQPPDDEPVTAYPLLASAEQPHRARGVEGLYAAMIGREREMEHLAACVDDLLSGRGGIVSISGEAGIGKTRLVSELKEYAGDRVQWLEGRCISYGQAMNYGPFRGIISSYLGILPTDTEEEMKAKLHSKVTSLLPEQQRWAPIHVGNLFFPQYEAELLTASGDDYAKQYTYPILRNMFHRIANEKPLVMVFEDLHWSDPTSLAVLEFLMESIDEAPILYVWLYRPYRDSGIWRLREQADRNLSYCNTQLDLSPLRSEDSDTLVSELLHIPDIPENMRTLVQDRASGNPLYVEEIIRSFIDEEAVVRDADYWRATVESASIVPSDTLQGVILERVDRLPPEDKEALQVSSVLGDGFSLSLLEHVTESGNLSASLRQLERAQMLQRKRVGQDWEYGFFHPLIHDVVYHSLLTEDRAVLHEKAGASIESMHSERLGDYIDMLAHHYGHSDNIEKALHYLTLAGDKAYELKSYWEALDYYGIAMAKAEELSNEHRRKQTIVDLVLKRTMPRHYLGTLQMDVEETEKYLEWAEELGDQEKLWRFYEYLTNHSSVAGDMVRVERYIKRDAYLLKKIRNIDHVEECYRLFCYFASDDFESLVALAQPAVEYIDKDNLPSNRSNFTARLSLLSKIYAFMGQWDKAMDLAQAVLDLASDDTGDTLSSSVIWANCGMEVIYIGMGEWEKAIEEGESAMSMSPSSLVSIEWLVAPLGDAYCESGHLSKSIDLLERWQAYIRRIGEVGKIIECDHCLPLAKAYFAQGDMDRALRNADRARYIAETQGYPIREAQAHRILGEIHSEIDFALASDHFSRSLEIMQRIKARNEEGITELSWGRACKQYGDMEQARVHLARAAKIFEELGTTRYLEWTREAIAELEDN